MRFCHFLWLLIPSLFWSCHPVVADEPAQVAQMLSYFGAGCSTNGDWTQSATKSVSGLVSTLQAIASDPNCQSLAGVVSDLQILNTSIQNLANPTSDNEIQILGLEARKRELVFLLGQATDPLEIQTLRNELNSAQVSLSEQGAQSGALARNDRKQRLARTMMGVISSTNQIFSKVSANELCWTRHPGILQEIGAFGSAIGQSAAFNYATSGKAMVIGSGLALMDNVINFFKVKKENRKIKIMSDSLEPTAMNCALENLSEIYCGAEDTKQAVRDLLTKPKIIQNPLWSGVDLLQRDLPKALEWLDLVRAGSEPSNSSNAERRNEIRNRKYRLDSSSEFVTGIVNEKEDEFSHAVGRDGQWSVVKEVIRQISGAIDQCRNSPMCSDANPLRKIFPGSVWPYILIGYTDINKVPTTGGLVRDIDLYDPFADPNLPNYQPSLTDVLKRFRVYWKQANDQLTIQKSIVINDDPELVIDTAFRQTFLDGQKGLSPRDSFLKIAEFLSTQVPNSVVQAGLPHLYRDTIHSFKSLVAEIDRVKKEIETNPDPETVSKDGITNIIKLARLDDGHDFLRNRTEYFVRAQLESLVFASQGTQDEGFIKYLAAQDVVEYLKSMSGRDEQGLVTDSNNAQSIVRRAHQAFLQTFAVPLEAALAVYDQQMKSSKDDPKDSPDLFSKSVLCANILGAPAWNFSFDMDRCRGTQVLSVIDQKLKSALVTPAAFSQLSFTQRMCNYRNFLRKNTIFQSLRNSPNSRRKAQAQGSQVRS